MGRTDEIEVKQYIENVLEKYKQKFDEKDNRTFEDLQEKVKTLSLKLKYFEQNW